MSKLVFGCGYLGGRVARQWRDAGHEVYAVTRRSEQAETYRRHGLLPVLADVTRAETLRDLPPADTVLYAVGYHWRSGLARRKVYTEGLRNVLEALTAEPKRIVHVSSTGVYGETDGSWVDESTACRPLRESSQALLAAEQLLRGHRCGRGAIILRMAGLYGPGRLPFRAAIVSGEPIAGPAEGYVNLIHVDDAAAVVVAAAERARPPRIYVVSDGNPGSRREVYGRMADLLGAAPPRFVDQTGQTSRDSRTRANKRVSNRRMLEEFGVKLAYPSYREGLAAVLT